MGFFIDNAWAQDAAVGEAGMLATFGPLVLIFVVFYFLLIRPQTKRQKEHKDMVAALNVGDEVVTAGGVLGKVTKMTDQFVRLEVSNGVEISVQRHTLGAIMPKGTIKAV